MKIHLHMYLSKTSFLCLIVLFAFSSCESEVRRPDAFELVKAEKSSHEFDSIKTEVLTEQSSKTIQKSNVSSELDVWLTYKNSVIEKIAENAAKIKALKSIPNLNPKILKNVANIEQSNTDLIIQLDLFKEETKSRWERFKTDMNEDVDGIKIELKSIEVMNKE